MEKQSKNYGIPKSVSVSDDVHICGNCKYHEDFSGACGNGLSFYVADFTLWTHTCDEWVGRKNKNEE